MAEVKQLNPNREEAKDEARNAKGHVFVFGHEPGDRLRPLISRANSQIRAVARPGEPGVLVVFDTRLLAPVEPYDALTAMYGLQTVQLSVPGNPYEPPRKAGDRFGPKRSVDPAYNRAVSAVVIIPQQDQPEKWAYVFHNLYAEAPLERKDLAGRCIRQFVVDGQPKERFADWREI